jgi:hypothetical protein
MTAILISSLKHAIKFFTEKFALAPRDGLFGKIGIAVIAEIDSGFGWHRTACQLP